jgi:3-hydroxy-3-methylglutaryl CoA synthase
MKVGILDFGMYIPHFRVARSDIGEAWRLEQAMPLLIGERSVAGYDEDSLTMAVEALLQAMAAHATAPVDAVLFASTTAPFGEKSCAAVVAAACDLHPNRTVDVGGSLGAGCSALSLAFDALRAGTARQAAVAVADMRRPEPGTLLEAISGDGAAALLLGAASGDETDPHLVAELVGEFHTSDPTIDCWRSRDDRYLRTDDEAFANQVGFFSMVHKAEEGLLEATGLSPDEISGVAVYAPDGRSLLKLARTSRLGACFNRMGTAGPAPTLLTRAGNLGAAFAVAQLVLLLASSSPGDRIALIGYGDGADAYLFEVTDAIVKGTARQAVKSWFDNRSTLPYTLALHFRENLAAKSLFPAEFDPWTSLPLLHRERDALLRFHAQRCNSCGTLWWPHRPACYECGEEDDFSSVRLSRRGKVSSFVVEWAIPSPLSPVGMVTTDTIEGARITSPSTDGDPRGLEIGDEVEFAFRIFHSAKRFPHYSWKVRKLRA